MDVKGQNHYPQTPAAVYDTMLQFLNQPGDDSPPSAVIIPGNTKVIYVMVHLVSVAEVEVDNTTKCPGVCGKTVERPCFNYVKCGHVMSDFPYLSEAERQSCKDRSAAR